MSAPGSSVADLLGEVGLPAPIAELARFRFDVVVVGGGHNGLTAAAYLARAGRSVLVAEARERLGGACTLERPFPDRRYVVSPCAYLLGLLDERVITELGLRSLGLEVFVADPDVFVPFEDGTAFTQWADDARTEESMKALGVSEKDVAGYFAFSRLYDDIRLRLRKGDRDVWLGESPTRGEIEELLGGDRFMTEVVFEASVADVLDGFIGDDRIKASLYAGGVIGTWAGPRDPGTAGVKLMHRMGDLEGRGAIWGYVRGGMGMVSFAIAEAARAAGAVLAAGVPVGEVLPGRGVRLEDGTLIEAAEVVCNADPKVLLSLLPADEVPAGLRRRFTDWDVRSPTVKFNAALASLPSFSAAPGESFMARGTVDLTGGIDASQAAFEEAKAGRATLSLGEVYFQTGHDPSVAPEGRHLMSIFGQYAPYDLEGGWEAGREGVARQFIELVERFAPGFERSIEAYEVLGPPDIEARNGLTGGHIFQGSVLPSQMWTKRLTPRTEVPHLYLCGAATHPGGSVIGLNGRNAAMALLADREAAGL
ncbi:MAG: phytoene desaturase family protein [Acidimicrobiales bacterium]